jgi:hypothetical protein
MTDSLKLEIRGHSEIHTLKTWDIKKRDNVKIKKTKNITTIYVEFLIWQQTIININSIYKKVINHKHI